MREIKFRAWDKRLKMWYMWGLNINPETGAYFTGPPHSDLIHCQFTGLRDKNGKEIFEGDVLQITSNLIRLSDRKDTGEISCVLEVVKWIDDGWGYEKIKNVQNYPGLIPHSSKGLTISSKYGEVIGNIYENEDLLK